MVPLADKNHIKSRLDNRTVTMPLAYAALNLHRRERVVCAVLLYRKRHVFG
eukprot:SAG31_NODE_35940_length_318_cov_0.707763_1_plen_50_part_10